MPGRDRTGPVGQGAMTGRQMGECRGNRRYRNDLTGRGNGYRRAMDHRVRQRRRIYSDPASASADFLDRIDASDIEIIAAGIAGLIHKVGDMIHRHREEKNKETESGN